MSLQDILEIRMNGMKPQGVVSLVIGEVPEALRGNPMYVELAPGSNPKTMDWRPLVGVWVAIFHIRTDWPMVNAVADALEAANVKLFGYADANGRHALVVDEDAELSRGITMALIKSWGMLCQS